MVEPVVSRCFVCGTQYTARAWPWLESLGGDGSRRVCAVPGCGFAITRIDQVGLALHLASRPTPPANDKGGSYV
jgi:hypothetical protein